MIMAMHRSCAGDWSSLAKKAGVPEPELTAFLEYAAQFLGNMGNFKSFGDSKFLPRCADKTVAALAATSPEAAKFYEATAGGIFSCSDAKMMHLGFPDAGHMTTYYPDSPGILKTDIDAISAWMEQKGLLPENNRLRKNSDGTFDILIASAVTSVPPEGGDIGKQTSFTVEDGPLQGKTIRLVYGDYSKEMATITAYIKQAAAHADNETQKEMHLAYAKSFETGSLEAFKDSQRFWIKDKGPMVECNIGFVETYRDPAGIRGEWEGFASMVNMERTRAFGELVSSAPKLIPLLPWGKDFEKDKFLSPDFTSLEVMTFAGQSCLPFFLLRLADRFLQARVSRQALICKRHVPRGGRLAFVMTLTDTLQPQLRRYPTDGRLQKCISRQCSECQGAKREDSLHSRGRLGGVQKVP